MKLFELSGLPKIYGSQPLFFNLKSSALLNPCLVFLTSLYKLGTTITSREKSIFNLNFQLVKDFNVTYQAC